MKFFLSTMPGLNGLIAKYVLLGFFTFAICSAGENNLEKWLLPKHHSIYPSLEKLFPSKKMFNDLDTVKKFGFYSCAQSEGILPNSILVLAHPNIPGYLFKKYANGTCGSDQLENYLARLNGAQTILNCIETLKLKHIVVPKKWLYKLSYSKQDDYLLIVEHLDICPGGWWGGLNYEKYQHMNKAQMKELCTILYIIGGCDAWPQNQPFTYSGKIAFIDTEHVGCSPNDFLQNTLPYINPSLQTQALKLWNRLEKKALQSSENK